MYSSHLHGPLLITATSLTGNSVAGIVCNQERFIHMIFPFDNDNPKGNRRTDESVRRDVQTAVDQITNGKVSKSTVNGHKGHFWFMYLRTFDNYLQNIKPTIFVTRIPRTLDDITHWKSSEYRNFLLYWGIPILRNILNNEFFVHVCLLVRSIFLLSKEGVT